ncbi:alpha/beta-hydrolase family protein [Intrasporangium sp.]|uniref:alpha/beta hydrolase n=1 Tax=Intrasporangium sp. TaxID=1925024 RepID=UPI003221E88C
MERPAEISEEIRRAPVVTARHVVRVARAVADRFGLSWTGLLFGAVYVVVALSPSLLPRTWFYQGLVCGICGAAGYGLGVLVAWVSRGVSRLLRLEIVVGEEQGHWVRVGWVALLTAGFVWAVVANIRSQAVTASRVHLQPLTPLDWVGVLALTPVVWVALVAAGRGIRHLTLGVEHRAARVLPTAVATVVAVVLVLFVAAWFTDNIVMQRGVQLFGRYSAHLNAQSPEGKSAPTSPLVSGGPGSLEPYGTLGFQGQVFVTQTLTPAQITAATRVPAKQPIRAYAGVHDGETIAQTADRVVAELQRTGAFDRKVLLVATTTGNGWVNDWSSQSVEYLTGGDCAIAAMQYSYLPSALELLTDRESPRQAGTVLFDKVYDVWSALPAASRPRLVVGGESLGAYGGLAAFGNVAGMLARAQGGVWSGTPSFSGIAEQLYAERTQGSPQISPVIDNGRHIRFSTKNVGLRTDYVGRPLGIWEQPRFVFLQHPSDPVVWWNPALLTTEPDWLREPLGRDVNPDVTWIPFVTFWQLTTDMAVGLNPPYGYGHRYGPEMVPAWGAVLGGEPGRDYGRILAAIERTVSRSE